MISSKKLTVLYTEGEKMSDETHTKCGFSSSDYVMECVACPCASNKSFAESNRRQNMKTESYQVKQKLKVR